ncbi:MAG TPA: VOC family protein [Roseateles sp.]|nr:VOC family protein [Roseateles sp.]
MDGRHKVAGIGGVFFKARDAAALRDWYRLHLGIDVQPWGGCAFSSGGGDTTVWSVMEQGNAYFDPSTAPFMINYRVADLHGLLAQLRAEGCAVDAKVDASEYGKFGWVMDPEGNRIELWEPPAGP